MVMSWSQNGSGNSFKVFSIAFGNYKRGQPIYTKKVAFLTFYRQMNRFHNTKLSPFRLSTKKCSPQRFILDVELSRYDRYHSAGIDVRLLVSLRWYVIYI